MAYVGQKPADKALTSSDIEDGSILNADINSSAAIATSKLASNAITINGSAIQLGGSVTTATLPTVTGVSPATITNDATTITITGTNFSSTIPQVEALNPSTGIYYAANSVSYSSSTSITANFTLTVDASYKIIVTNLDTGNSGISSSALLTVSDAPTFSTSAGSLGTVAAGASVSLDVDASSDSTVAFSETTSVLTSNSNTPAATMNLTLNSSTGAITGTAPSPTSATTYTFTLRATDAESQTVDRQFTITISVGATGGAQFN